MLEIKGVFLLSEAQYEGYKRIIPQLDGQWWLQDSYGATTPYSRFVKIVNIRGVISSTSCFEEKSVRPALVLNGVMPVGCVFEFAGVGWTVVSTISKTSIVVCNAAIAQRRFDIKNNEWNNSELKKWLEEWVEYVCLGSDEAVYNPEYHY